MLAKSDLLPSILGTCGSKLYSKVLMSDVGFLDPLHKLCMLHRTLRLNIVYKNGHPSKLQLFVILILLISFFLYLVFLFLCGPIRSFPSIPSCS